MVRSMTTFARSSQRAKSGNWVVELRAVNHRYFEFSMKLPSALNPHEGELRERVHARIKRGKITVDINVEDDGNKKIVLNEKVVDAYLSVARRLKKQNGLGGELKVSDLVGLPGIFTVEKNTLHSAKDLKTIEKVLDQTIERAIKVKEAEGRKLAKDILARLQTITAALGKIEKESTGAPEAIYQKLSARLDRLLLEREKDPDRLHREVAFLAERSDITEEVVRLKSHFGAFRERLDSAKTGEIGRELDFLCQEMHREINTIGSKSQLFEISGEVVFIKGELEKIREQVQNIE